MIRAITLPNGRQCSVGVYVKAWRALQRMPQDELVKGFSYDYDSAGYILQRMREGIHDRINRHDRRYGIGRKWSPDWQRATYHCARNVNTPRLIVRKGQVPYWLRDQLAHRICTDD